MLVRLISAGQVVLLYDPPKIYLFYRGRVYSRLAMYGFAELPGRRRMVYCPMWALIDTDMKNEEPPIPSSPVIWPVQAISPRPALWKPWSNQTEACLSGMPLWDMEELMKGYVFSLLSLSAIDPGHGLSLTVLRLFRSLSLQLGYKYFRSRLEQLLPLPDVSTLPTTDDKAKLPTPGKLAVNTALKILQTAREVEKDEDRGEVGDGLGVSAADRDKASQPQTPMDNVDNALKILVHNAIEEFGFVPRDVYSSVLRARDTKDRHVVAVKVLTCTDLFIVLRRPWIHFQHLASSDRSVPSPTDVGRYPMVCSDR